MGSRNIYLGSRNIDLGFQKFPINRTEQNKTEQNKTEQNRTELWVCLEAALLSLLHFFYISLIVIFPPIVKRSVIYPSNFTSKDRFIVLIK